VIERAIGLVLAVASAAAIVWASSAPLTVNRSENAVLRLAWGARPERIETCRELGPEELANVPQHMRQERICEGVTAEYRLLVTDEAGAVKVDRVIRGGGLRQDRRLYVFEETPIPPGPAAFDVRFERVTQAAEPQPQSHEEREDGTGDGRQGDGERRGTVPPSLSLALRVTVEPRQVVLVTYDPERRELVALTGSSR
jgi:hypothetical protein